MAALNMFEGVIRQKKISYTNRMQIRCFSKSQKFQNLIFWATPDGFFLFILLNVPIGLFFYLAATDFLDILRKIKTLKKRLKALKQFQD